MLADVEKLSTTPAENIMYLNNFSNKVNNFMGGLLI